MHKTARHTVITTVTVSRSSAVGRLVGRRQVWCEHRSRALLAQLQLPAAESAVHDVWVVNLHLEGSPYRPNDRCACDCVVVGLLTTAPSAGLAYYDDTRCMPTGLRTTALVLSATAPITRVATCSVSQLRSALARLEARQLAVGCEPATANVIVCGDFNSDRGETPWRLLSRSCFALALVDVPHCLP